jgi:hypothetical protein
MKTMPNHLLRHSSALALPLVLFAAACGSSDDNATAGAGGAGGSTSTTTGSAGSTTSGGGETSAGGGGATSGGGTAGGGGTSAGAGGTGGNADAGDAPDAICAPSGPLHRPTVPAAIEAPAGATVIARYHAVGKQIYTCTATSSDAGADAATTYAWTLKAPDATLWDSECHMAGTHFAGPTWKSTDGSSVVGARLASAASATANSIPQLLLKAMTTSGEGIFANVTFVQRLDTIGGIAPADGCNAGTVNAESSIDYNANYYFYTGGATEGGIAVTSFGPGE